MISILLLDEKIERHSHAQSPSFGQYIIIPKVLEYLIYFLRAPGRKQHFTKPLSL